ncbi:hypothetical protein Cgig2_020485 [Carnegiea gigantea]|uniref:Uncharacterized protein n=1 Tax=Carnegiea gigantea TaxID=171969 RepID=A0A9Q1KDP6_9CARY|nr:hypothetical protein Cgig2_020485 [Carnegiea gigantea]
MSTFDEIIVKRMYTIIKCIIEIKGCDLLFILDALDRIFSATIASILVYWGHGQERSIECEFNLIERLHLYFGVKNKIGERGKIGVTRSEAGISGKQERMGWIPFKETEMAWVQFFPFKKTERMGWIPEKFKKRKDELKLPNTSAEGDAAGCTAVEVEAEEQPTQAIKEVKTWKESVGFTKKGKIYGLRLHASTFKDSSSGNTPEFKAAVAEVASKLEVVQKANEEKEKEMERLTKENKRLKQKVNIFFEKFNMAPLGDSDYNDDEDE